MAVIPVIFRGEAEMDLKWIYCDLDRYDLTWAVCRLAEADTQTLRPPQRYRDSDGGKT